MTSVGDADCQSEDSTATVQGIPEIPDLNLTLLAGAGSTSNPVRWVHITEVPDPTKWLKGGELLLTTGYGFAGSPDQQVEQH